MPSRYDPEHAVAALRAARAADVDLAEMAAIVTVVATRMRHLWPNVADRETAGLGAVVIADVLRDVAAMTGQTGTCDLIGLVGLALVDDARAHMDALRVLDPDTVWDGWYDEAVVA